MCRIAGEHVDDELIIQLKKALKESIKINHEYVKIQHNILEKYHREKYREFKKQMRRWFGNNG